MDLSPITLKQVEWKGRILEADPPLEFHPYLEAGSRPSIGVEDDEEGGLDLIAWGYTRDELLADITESIFFVWDKYTKGDPFCLSPGATRLGEAYKKRFTLVTNE